MLAADMVPPRAPASDQLVDDFKLAMRQLAAGAVTISAIDRGRRSGLTAIAACSLTTAPPSVLVSVNRSSQTHDYIANSGRFCMNALAEQHRDVAKVFAGATRPEPNT